MSALQANRVTRSKEGKTFDFKVGVNKHIYAGSLVYVDDTTGHLEPATNAGSKTFAGVAGAEVNNNPGLAGAKSCRVLRKGVHLFAKTSATDGDVGAEAYAVDDQTVALSGSGPKVGKIIGVEDSSHVWVAIDNYA
jgi:predicted RecA/RadA family phage recombinase